VNLVIVSLVLDKLEVRLEGLCRELDNSTRQSCTPKNPNFLILGKLLTYINSQFQNSNIILRNDACLVTCSKLFDLLTSTSVEEGALESKFHIRTVGVPLADRCVWHEFDTGVSITRIILSW